MKLSELLFLKVMSIEGKALGHVLDLRCESKAETNEADVREFVYGYGGLLERLGLKKINRERISWEAVLRIDEGLLIVQETPCGVKPQAD
jgi:sporulation protein YlmC with PRC-barrel domain